jgi:hypothetical protein
MRWLWREWWLRAREIELYLDVERWQWPGLEINHKGGWANAWVGPLSLEITWYTPERYAWDCHLRGSQFPWSPL